MDTDAKHGTEVTMVQGCRHCGTGKINRPRGLCWNCYYAPGVREQYPSTSKYARHGIETNDEMRKPASAPTSHPPGTKEKMAVMSERWANGEELYHPQDADMTKAVGAELRPFQGLDNYRGSDECDEGVE